MTAIAARPTLPPQLTPGERARAARVRLVMTVLVVALIAALAASLLADLKGSLTYALNLRSRQAAALVVVGAAIGVSSLVFQTIAGSRILTPGVMGFDSLYLLIQTMIVYLFGSAVLLGLSGPVRFMVNVVAMTAFGLLLFRWLFRRGSRNLFVLVLVGVVCGSLFTSLTTFASRLLSPDDYLTLQDVMFASFGRVNPQLLAVTAAVAVVGVLLLIPLLRSLDAVDLGYDQAVARGVPYHRVVTRSLIVVTILVSTATALVGPMIFLGLIVANLARQLLPTFRHIVLAWAAGIVGALCAGKSTLLSLASRLLTPDAGRILVDDLDLAATAGDVVARRLAVLRQENRVGARLTVLDLVRFGRYPYSKGRLTAVDHQHVHDALSYLELSDLQDRYLDQLSGGQRQRAFIAMVLAQDTEYVLLDEPLNNLDMRHAVQMMRRLRRLVDEMGKTVVVVLHDVNFAAAHADHIVALRAGLVVAQGPPSEIVRPDVLQSVYDLQVPVVQVEGHPVAVYFR